MYRYVLPHCYHQALLFGCDRTVPTGMAYMVVVVIERTLRVFDDCGSCRILPYIPQQRIESHQVSKQSLFFILCLAFPTGYVHDLAGVEERLASISSIPDHNHFFLCIHLLGP